MARVATHGNLLVAYQDASATLNHHFGGVRWGEVQLWPLAQPVESPIEPVRAAFVHAALSVLAADIAADASAGPQEVNVYKLMLRWAEDIRTGAWAERHAGLDAVYQAFEALDDDAKDLATALAPARRACDRLDSSDLLLGAARAQCRSALKLILLDDPSCPTRTRCLQQFREVRRLTEQVIADSRELNGAIENVVSTKRCRIFLRSDRAEIAGFERLVRGYQRVEAALKTTSKARVRAALRKLEAIPEPSGSDDTSKRTFRDECPSGS